MVAPAFPFKYLVPACSTLLQFVSFTEYTVCLYSVCIIICVFKNLLHDFQVNDFDFLYIGRSKSLRLTEINPLIYILTIQEQYPVSLHAGIPTGYL